jgi:hypothetical protein
LVSIGLIKKKILVKSGGHIEQTYFDILMKIFYQNMCIDDCSIYSYSEGSIGYNFL